MCWVQPPCGYHGPSLAGGGEGVSVSHQPEDLLVPTLTSTLPSGLWDQHLSASIQPPNHRNNVQHQPRPKNTRKDSRGEILAPSE